MPHAIAKSDLRGRLTQLRRAAREMPLIAGLCVLALVSLVFLLAPGLDLAASRLFYEPVAGFSQAGSAFLEGVRVSGRFIEWAFALAMLLPLLIKIVWPDSDLVLQPRKTLFVLATFALGPGLS